MRSKRRLTRSQERRRFEGLRILARIIARHYLAHPELYPGPGADGAVPPPTTATGPQTARPGARRAGMAHKPATKRVMLKTEAAWELLRQRNWSQNDLAREAGLSRG